MGTQISGDDFAIMESVACSSRILGVYYARAEGRAATEGVKARIGRTRTRDVHYRKRERERERRRREYVCGKGRE